MKVLCSEGIANHTDPESCAVLREMQGEALTDTELHLSGCLACQSTVREYSSSPQRLHSAFPLGGVAAAAAHEGLLHRISDGLQSAYAWLQERIAAHLPALQQSSEMSAARKAALVAGATASIVAGETEAAIGAAMVAYVEKAGAS